MQHKLKIKQCFLIHLLDGRKTFDVRKNDRDFQVGDTIQFLPLEDENYCAYDVMSPLPQYQINYVLADFSGLQQNHVVLAITPIKEL